MSSTNLILSHKVNLNTTKVKISPILMKINYINCHKHTQFEYVLLAKCHTQLQGASLCLVLVFPWFHT